LKAILAVTFLAATLGGCGLAPPSPPVTLQTQFIGSEHNAYLATGTASIDGQGFLRQKGGGVVTCAGSKVALIPATPFFREALGHLRAGRKVAAMEQLDSSYRPLLKQSQCDAQGNFHFQGLPAGKWFIFTEVKWTVGYKQQGGTLLREIELLPGRSEKALLSDNDFAGR
jgi:hypothetical protein